MARIKTTTFDSQVNATEFVSIVGTPTYSTTIKRNGDAAVRFNASGSEISGQLTTDAGAGDFVHRVYVRFASFPASLTKIIQLRDGGGDHTSIRINSSGTLELWTDTGATQYGSDSSALSLDTWYYIELDAGTTHTGDDVIARLNGTQFASNATHGAGANHRVIEVGVMGAVTCDMYVDDHATNNHSGGSDNTFPGEEPITSLGVSVSESITVEDIPRYYDDEVYVFESVVIEPHFPITVSDSITITENGIADDQSAADISVGSGALIAEVTA